MQVAAQNQTPKQLPARRLGAAIKIDGKLDDIAWKEAPMATNFVELRPVAFRKEEEANRTEVYFLYNDQGVFMGGYCHEKTKDSIQTELIGRDNFGSNDFIGVIFDTYNDKINGFEYFLTPLNEQMDAKQAANSNGDSEDFSWNSVWKSGTSIVKDGWTFEFFIPYSAIRFSKKGRQDWGLNIVRRRQKSGQQLFWNPIDPVKNGFLTQEGFWTGIEDIKPPVRLSFSPYFSSYVNNYPYNTAGIKNTTTSLNGGMDVKYGISQAYTLDMTLIPDFGQVQSDNQVLNLTPFEVKYNENRSFFTEGTELFSKGNLFYSRRVGGTPLHFYDVSNDVNSNERIVRNPAESKLLNATKLSGRSKSGLGIGIFNAVTKAQYAIAEDGTGKQRKIENDPLTNYNVFVLDQTMKNNSSVSFVNTNVIRNGSDYDANVSAGLFNLYDKKNKWNVYGKAYSSTLFNKDQKNSTGYKYNLGMGKVSGKFNFQLESTLHDDKFDFNDMGYMTFTNYWEKLLYLGYNFVKPKRIFSRLYHNFNFSYTHRYKPYSYQNTNISYNVNGQLKNLWYTGANLFFSPTGNDFYEPRHAGRVFRTPVNIGFGNFVESNSAKKYYAEASYVFNFFELKGWKELQVSLFHRYRFNNKISLSHQVSYSPRWNNVGFAAIVPGADPQQEDSVIFARRNRNTIENVMRIKYSFNTSMYITLRARHYWSKVTNLEFFTMGKEGQLVNNTSFNQRLNQNYNAFNIDMVYSWRFAPGSEINIVWKNAIGTFDREVVTNYFKNVSNTLGAPQNNSISFKILYFLDYLQLQKKKL
ncbi:MAG: DUF5916 domain-containing protein [Chitinophagaceae bacterium]